MSFITINPGFRAGVQSLNINGVLSATFPLIIDGTVISAANASATTSGVLTAGLQNIGGVKNFVDGIQLNSTQAVSSISTDNTFVGATDTELATRKATKEFVEGYVPAPFITSVSLPLEVTLGNLTIRAASATESGIVTIGDQKFEGEKTFKDLLKASSDIFLDHIVGTTIRQTSIDAWVELTTRTGGSIRINDGSAPNSNVIITAAEAGGSLISMRTGVPSATCLTVESSNVSAYRPVNIITSTEPQLVLYNGTANAYINLTGAGDMTINCTGNDLNFHSTDQVHVLNSTASTSKTTGALTVSGGAGINGNITANQLVLDGSSNPKMTLTSPTGTTTFTQQSGGQLTIYTTSTTVPYVEFDTPAGTQFRISDSRIYCDSLLEANQGIKYDDVPAQFTPTGAGPFDNFLIGAIGTVFYIDCNSVTSGAQFRGIDGVSTINSRKIILNFTQTAGTKIINLIHNSLGSLPGNRLYCPGGVTYSLTVGPVGVAEFLYSTLFNVWILTNR